MLVAFVYDDVWIMCSQKYASVRMVRCRIKARGKLIHKISSKYFLLEKIRFFLSRLFGKFTGGLLHYGNGGSTLMVGLRVVEVGLIHQRLRLCRGRKRAPNGRSPLGSGPEGCGPVETLS